MNDTYDDIISLPRPVSRTRAPMPLASRAAQFAPFAALSGHAEALASVEEKEEDDHVFSRVASTRLPPGPGLSDAGSYSPDDA